MGFFDVSQPHKKGVVARGAALIASFTLFVTGSLTLVPSAIADVGDPQYLQLYKEVNPEGTTLEPGDEFTYSVRVICSEVFCKNAKIVDGFSPELAEFQIIGVDASVAGSAVSPVVTWTGSTTQPATVGSGDLEVTFTGANEGAGLPAGTTVFLNITLKVPATYPVTTQPDAILNTAEVTADNSSPATDDVEILVSAAPIFDVKATKSWSPESQKAAPGQESSITIGAVNASNNPVTELAITEPSVATGSTLDPATNPFAVANYSSITVNSIPAGCTALTPLFYVEQGGTWAWVDGTAAPSNPSVVTDPEDIQISLPSGVNAVDVGGVSLKCSDASNQILPSGELNATIVVEQRAEIRGTSTPIGSAERTIRNTVLAELEDTEGSGSATDTASDQLVITPVTASVRLSKNISPSPITAGDKSKLNLVATNGREPVETLKISENPLFSPTPAIDGKVVFAGFEQVQFPVGADTATIVYYYTDSTTSTETMTETGVPGTGPTIGKTVSGFEITYVGDLIEANSTATVRAELNTTKTAASAVNKEVEYLNNATATVSPPIGSDASASANSELKVLFPEVSAALQKLIRPGGAVEVDDNVLVTLQTTSKAVTEGTEMTQIVVSDPDGVGASEFWDAFDFLGIGDTPIPEDSELSLAALVCDSSGQSCVWTPIATPTNPSVATFTMAQDEVLSVLGIVDPSLIFGIQGTLRPLPGQKFPDTVNFNLNILATARDSLKSTGLSVDPDTSDEVGVEYRNSAAISVTGVGPGDDPATVNDSATASKSAEIVALPSTGGPLEIRKSWIEGNPVAALSATNNLDDDAGQAVSRIRWQVEPDAENVTIQDVAGDFDSSANAPAVDTTVFDAFNLVEIQPITAFTGDPVTTDQINRKFMTFDDVVSVELFNGSGWSSASAPSGGWMTSAGGFRGYKLTAAEQQSTLSVRIRIEPNDSRRDPNSQVYPRPGNGVAHNVFRYFDLTWEIRDVLRSNTAIVVNEDPQYNLAPLTGSVENTASIKGCFSAASPFPGCQENERSATINIVEVPPAVSVAKSWEKNYPGPVEDVYPEYIYTPPAGSNQARMPSQLWHIQAHNASLTKATHLQITDPSLCLESATAACTLPAPGNPFTGLSGQTTLDFFGEPAISRYFDYTNLQIDITQPDEIDKQESFVYLLKWNNGSPTTTVHTLNAFEALTGSALEAELADVVAFSVLLAGLPGPGPSPTYPTNTIDSQNVVTVHATTVLRKTERDTGDDNVISIEEQRLAVTNRVSAQSFDMVNSPSGVAVDLDHTTAYLAGGIFEIIPGKTITPDVIVEPNARQQATVTLTVNDGVSTISPNLIEVEDRVGSEDFWDRFDLVGTGAVELPLGADAFRIDVYNTAVNDWAFGERQTIGGASSYPEYANSLSGSAAQVPTNQIDGIRIMFFRKDGEFLSQLIPTPDWHASFEFKVIKRTHLRSNPATLIPFDPESTWTNTQRSHMLREDGQQTAWETASDDISLTPGTYALGINKEANNGVEMVNPGTAVPYVITVRNTGTGFLDLTELEDVLPAGLEFSGEPSDAPVYEGFDEEPTFTQGTSPSTMKFEWPAPGVRLAPNEEASITFKLQVLGGQPYVPVRNDVTAHTTQDLSACTNLDPDRAEDVVFDPTGDPKSCGTWDSVKLRDIPNILTYKAVKGSIEGGHVKGTDIACRKLSDLMGDSVSAPDFYRGQCIANSQHYYEEGGVEYGVDEWQLEVVNAGTRALDQIEVFDSFPEVGDTYLVNGVTRESEYRPQIIAAPVFGGRAAGMEGTAVAEISTDSGACVDTWADLSVTSNTDLPCNASAATWTAQDVATDWNEVRAYRVRLDFTAQPFKPGERLYLRFKTKNAIDVDGASSEVPVSDQQAINQFGATYSEVGKAAKYPIAESFVGVHLMSGSFEVRKDVRGAAAAFAPQEFTFEAACTLGGQPITFTSAPNVTPTATGATVTVKRSEGYAHQISGVPVGSDCTVTETGAVGRFGEAARIGDGVSIKVAQADPAGQTSIETPVAQIASISNVYNYGHLAVTKQIDSLENTGAEFGPFKFEVSCAPINGNAFPTAKFELMGGETWTSARDLLPAGADCVVTETDSGTAFSARAVSSTQSTVSTVQALLRLAQSPVGAVPSHQVTVTSSDQGIAFENSFLTGSLQVTKKVSGTGADGLGEGPFTVRSTCTYNGKTIYEGDVVLKNGETKPFLTDSGKTAVFPAQTKCDLTETNAGGAVSSKIPGQLTIVGGDTPAETKMNTAEVSNLFATGDAQVTKAFEGKFAWQGETLSFNAAVECTYQAFGKPVNYTWAGDARLVVELSPQNHHSVTVQGLPAGSECVIAEELNPQGATLVEYSDPVVVVAGDTADLSVTNTFGADLGILGVDDGKEPVSGGDRSLPDTGINSTAGIAALIVFAIGAALVASRRYGSREEKVHVLEDDPHFNDSLAQELGFDNRDR